MTFALVFNGKVQTSDPEVFKQKFQTLVDETNSLFIGKVETYQIAEYVEYQKIEENTDSKEEDNVKV